MTPDEPNEEEKLEELPEDYETPFRPGGSQRQSSSAYPFEDVRPDSTEAYQQGTDLDEPNADSRVEGYDPSRDRRLR